MAGDLYLSRDATRGRDEWRPRHRTHHYSRPRRQGRRRDPQVLRRAHPIVVGEFRITRRGMFVVPHDERIKDWIEIPQDMAIPPQVGADGPDRGEGRSRSSNPAIWTA